MMHVAHVVHSLEVGGTENGVVNLVGALREVRHSVVAVTATGPLAARLPAGVPVSCVHKRAGIDVRAVGRFVAAFRALRPDVVHTRNWASFDAVVAARVAGVRVVIHGEHGREIGDPEGRNPRRNRIRKLLSPLVTGFVAVTHDLERWLVERVGIPAHKVVTIPNGVDTRRFVDGDRPAARAALGAPHGSLVIGTVGRLDPVKDQVGFLRAFARVAARYPTALAVLVGDGPCRAALEQEIASLGLDGRARLLGNRLDVPRLLPGFDLFSLPSIAEGMSNTVLEAMAAGLPVVATRVGGTPDMVDDGVTGALVAPRDVAGLAAAFDAYLADPFLRASHGKAGQARALTEFSLERMAATYGALYAARGRMAARGGAALNRTGARA